MLRRWPYLIPVAYFAFIVWMQPSDRPMIPYNPKPETVNYPLPGGTSRWVTDECDTLAYVIRAENALRGRKGGLKGPMKLDPQYGWIQSNNLDDPLRPFEPGYKFYDNELAELDRDYAENRALRERYFLEYPPLALYLFELEMFLTGRSNSWVINSTILDSHQLNVGWHVPRTPDEASLFQCFRRAMSIHTALMLLALIGSLILLERGLGADGTAKGPIWLLILPGFLYYTPCRFDVLPAFLVIASIAVGERKKPFFAGLLLGLAVAFKMYPLVIGPLLLRRAGTSWGSAFAWCLGAAIAPVLSYGAMFLTDGADGATVPLWFQLARGAEAEWCFYGKFLPGEWTFDTTAAKLTRTLPVLGIVLLMCLRRPPDVYSLLRRCSIGLIAFLTFSVFYSPQWYQWLAVLLIPLVPRHRWLIGVIVFHDLMSYLHFPVLFDAIGHGAFPKDCVELIRSTHVWIRAEIWLGLFIAFGWHELKNTSLRSGSDANLQPNRT